MERQKNTEVGVDRFAKPSSKYSKLSHRDKPRLKILENQSSAQLQRAQNKTSNASTPKQFIANQFFLFIFFYLLFFFLYRSSAKSHYFIDLKEHLPTQQIANQKATRNLLNIFSIFFRNLRLKSIR